LRSSETQKTYIYYIVRAIISQSPAHICWNRLHFFNIWNCLFLLKYFVTHTLFWKVRILWHFTLSKIYLARIKRPTYKDRTHTTFRAGFLSEAHTDNGSNVYIVYLHMYIK
jgi:hypothetical protein